MNKNIKLNGKYIDGWVFDINDYFDINGLYRPFDFNGNTLCPFLLPIYFNKKVLIKYFHDSNYTCEIFSETYGYISFKDEWNIAFGINKNGKVLMWLGDILKLPNTEQSNLRHYNEDSDNDIESEFYDAQINIQFSEPTIETGIFINLEKTNSLFLKKYGYKLFNIDFSIEDLLECAKKFKRIILNSEDDFKSFISDLNTIIIETINKDYIVKILLNDGVQKNKIKNFGSIKLLEKYLCFTLGDNQNIISSIFSLSDIRVHLLHKHGSNNIHNFKETLKRIGISNTSYSYLEIYNNLIKELKDFSDSFLNLLQK